MNFDNHPCFNDKTRHKFGRVHLPVAPKCNIQCYYCDRKYDCVNESRPGVTSNIFTPKQALKYLENIAQKNPGITVVGIAGPGDPFANPDETLETLNLIRENFPEMMLCVATNGLNLLPYAKKLAELKISHVTITLNTIDPEIGAKIYAWVRYDKKIYRGIQGAELLLEKQIESIKILKEYGIFVKINTIIIPSINENHILDVVKKVKELGVDIINCIPIHPNKDTLFENILEPSKELVKNIRLNVEKYIPQMHHCTRCRADAVGFIDEEMDEEKFLDIKKFANLPINPCKNSPYVAVTSMEGVLINQHLGEAENVWIYENINGQPILIGKRTLPSSGTGNKRWYDFTEIIKDCNSILVSGAGDNPKNIFIEKGIKIVVTNGIIEETLENYFNGKSIYIPKKREGCSKGIECSGNGTGCG